MAKGPKRASKRTSTKQRVKVEKKVREHHRKQRREAKKNPQWRTKKQADPGIPNSFPYKEQLLDEIQMRRDREEQRKLEEREKRIAERKKGKAPASDDEDDEDEDDAMLAAEDEEELPELARPTNAPFYTGSLQELLDDDEVKNIVFALDARDPEAWRCEQVESAAKSKGKAVHLAVTRCDLVPLEALVSHLHTLTTSSSSPIHTVSARSAGGASSLTAALKGKGGSAFVGFENSGRSALATLAFNELGEAGAVKVYDTTHLLPIRHSSVSEDGEDEDEDEDVEDEDEDEDEEEAYDGSDDFDSQRSNAYRLLMRNKGKVERTKDPLPLLWALLPLVSQSEDLMLLYNVPAFGSYRPSLPPTSEDLTETEKDLHTRSELNNKICKDTEEFLIGLARVQGRARKHGIPDVTAAARVVLRDWSAGCLGYYTTATGWTKIPKAEREEITLKMRADLEKKGLGKVVQSRKDWRKSFIETQKERRDLHPSPAVGELRLKSAGRGALAGLEAESFGFWRPREIIQDVGEDEEDEDEIEGLIASDDDDDEADEEMIDENEEEDEEEEEEEEEEEAAPLPKSALRQASRQAKAKSLAALGPAVSAKKRVRVVEPSKKEKRRTG